MSRSVQRTKIYDATALTASAAATLSGWKNIGNNQYRPRGFVVYITSSGSPTVALTLRYSFFSTTDAAYPAATAGNYTEVTLVDAAAKTTWYYFYPDAMLLPIEAYTLTAAASTADCTLNVWEIAVPCESHTLYMNDLGVATIPATIANTASVTAALRPIGTLVGGYAPAMAATTAHLVPSVSNDGVTYTILYDAAGTQYTIAVGTAAARNFYIDPTVLTGWRYLKLTATTSDKSTAVAQDAAKAIVLYSRSV